MDQLNCQNRPRGKQTRGLRGPQGPKGDRGKKGNRGIVDLCIWLPNFVLQVFRKIEQCCSSFPMSGSGC